MRRSIWGDRPVNQELSFPGEIYDTKSHLSVCHQTKKPASPDAVSQSAARPLIAIELPSPFSKPKPLQRVQSRAHISSYDSRRIAAANADISNLLLCQPPHRPQVPWPTSWERNTSWTRARTSTSTWRPSVSIFSHNTRILLFYPGTRRRHPKNRHAYQDSWSRI